MSDYPTRRELDGIFFRCQRDGRWINRCWTDMTQEERERVSSDRPASWWQSMAEHLADRLRTVGDQLDLYCYPEEDEE